MKITLATALVLLGVPALAQAPTRYSGDPGSDWSVDLRGSAFAESDLDSGGDLSLTRVAVGVTNQSRSEDHFALYSYEHERTKYVFGNAGSLVVTDPFEDTRTESLVASFAGVGDDLLWFAGVSGHFGREQGENLSDSFYAKARGGLLWQVGTNFHLGIALYLRTFLEDDVALIPLPAIEWRPSKEVRVGIVRSTDPGIGLFYRLSERAEAYVSAHFPLRQYRLADKGLLVDGAATDDEQSLRVGLLWRDEAVRAEVFAGLAQREITIDVNDRQVAQDDVDATGMLGLAVSIVL